MIRTLIAALVGAIVLFTWGFLHWGHAYSDPSGTLRPIPNEAVSVGALKTNLGSSAVYYFPPHTTATADPAAIKAAQEEWLRKYETGPSGIIIYRAEGVTPMSPTMLLRGFLINFASALLVTLILMGFASGGMGFFRRWAIAIMMGLFAALSTDAIRGNFMAFPESWTRLLMLDTIVGWTLAGFAIALIAKQATRSAPATA
jgi:hypothetical protein